MTLSKPVMHVFLIIDWYLNIYNNENNHNDNKITKCIKEQTILSCSSSSFCRFSSSSFTRRASISALLQTKSVQLWSSIIYCMMPTVAISIFWHPGTLTLSPEHQNARMSKITNDGLTLSGTGCFIAVLIWQQWASKDKIMQKDWNNPLLCKLASPTCGQLTAELVAVCLKTFEC